MMREWVIPLPRSRFGSGRPPGGFFQRHPVHITEFRSQVLQVGLGSQVGSRGALDDFLREELATVPVYVLAEPAQQRRELPAPDVLEQGWVGPAGGFKELHGDDIAEGVGREVADGGAGPVG